MNLYRESLSLGGWYSFNANKKDWKNFYAEKMFNHFFNDSIKEHFGNLNIDENLLITDNVDFSNLQNKEVLVIGAGMSSSLLSKKVVNSYDYVFSCNHFYKNNFLSTQKINLILVGDEVDLKSKDFLEYLEAFKPLIGFEHSSKRSTDELISFKKNYERSFIYLTRYFSRLGYVPRAMILASIFGATSVDCIGLDGFNKERAHFFEKDKKAPSFNNKESFQEQMKILGKYFLEDLKMSKDSFCNLGETHPSNIYKNIFDSCKKGC